MGDTKKRLLQIFQQLNDQQQQSVLDYIEFLHQQSSRLESSNTEETKLSPELQPGPDNESVINAIKRLRASYYMIDTDGMLNETSSLMTQHIMQGREASDVIAELEALFDQQYQDYLKS